MSIFSTVLCSSLSGLSGAVSYSMLSRCVWGPPVEVAVESWSYTARYFKCMDVSILHRFLP